MLCGMARGRKINNVIGNVATLYPQAHQIVKHALLMLKYLMSEGFSLQVCLS